MVYHKWCKTLPPITPELADGASFAGALSGLALAGAPPVAAAPAAATGDAAAAATPDAAAAAPADAGITGTTGDLGAGTLVAEATPAKAKAQRLSFIFSIPNW